MAYNSISESYSEQLNPKANGTSKLKMFLEELFQGSTPRYASFSFTLDAIDPLAYLEMCWQEDTFQYYWEKPADEFAIAAGGELCRISASGDDRFNTVDSQLQSIQSAMAEYSSVPHPYSGMMFLGGFSFFDELSENLWEAFEPASFTVPKWGVIKDGKFNLVTLSVDLSAFNSAEKLHRHLISEFKKIRQRCDLNLQASNSDKNSFSLTDRGIRSNGNGEYQQWISSVKKAKNLIEEDNFDKIVLARHITTSNNQNATPTQVLNKLRNQYVSCYNFLIHRPCNKTFLGSTPERLGSFRNQLLLTEALAGSTHRGETATEDSILEKNLSGSSKDQNEHNFVIKDIEERLTPLAQSISRSQTPEVKKLSNVQHLYTPMRIQLDRDVNILKVLRQLHPTPAVGGYPWEKAAPYLDELENFERGWYASPVGWLNSKGMGEFAVGIRSGLLTEDKAHFFAGCGIVADSDPAAEWEEINLKFKPMLSAFQYD